MVAILQTGFIGQPVWLWCVFGTVVTALLGFDLGILHGTDRDIGVRESLLLSLLYIGVASLFGAFLWWQLGATPGTEFFTGFVVEKSLSLDNVFVIAAIFGYLAIPRQYQHRVLFWGIVGVLILRALMVSLGTAVVSQADWILYVFGIFLAAVVHRFAYLKYALALVLIFIGSKIFLVGIVGKIPASVSLSVTAALLLGGIAVSMFKTRNGAATQGSNPEQQPVVAKRRPYSVRDGLH